MIHLNYFVGQDRPGKMITRAISRPAPRRWIRLS
jgi:hypothetical protein